MIKEETVALEQAQEENTPDCLYCPCNGNVSLCGQDISDWDEVPFEATDVILCPMCVLTNEDPYWVCPFCGES